MSTYMQLSLHMGMFMESTVEVSDQVFRDTITSLTWAESKGMFLDEYRSYINTIDACSCDGDWSPLCYIKLTITYNLAANKFGCWEIGGATTNEGSAIVIGLPNSQKSLALAAFKTHRKPNQTHAVVQIWPGSIITLTTQSKGHGHVLLYRISDIYPEEIEHVHKLTGDVKNVQKFTASLKLCKVFNIMTREVVAYNRELESIHIDHSIVQASITKATMYDCTRALYIRPYYFVKEGYKDWNIEKISYTTEYNTNESLMQLHELSTTISSSSLSINKPDNILVGMYISDTVRGTDSPIYVRVMIVVIIRNLIVTSDMYNINESTFKEHSDMFECSSFSELIQKADLTDDLYKTTIGKYVGN